MTRNDDLVTPKKVMMMTGTGALVLAVLVGLVMGTVWGFKAFNRSQRVAEAENVVTTSRIAANNQVKLNEIRIGQQKQKVKIAEQDAEIRLREAQGVRKAQDEISGTLTPLYVQYEMTKQLSKIAKSGKNSSVIYIPVGPDGVPITAVEKPNDKQN